MTIPNGCTTIGQYAFANNGMTSVNVPDTVISLGNYAFVNCSNISVLDIPSSVMTVNTSAVGGSCGINGTVIIRGNLSGGGSYTPASVQCKHLVVFGSWSAIDGGVPPMHNVYANSVRIKGDLIRPTTTWTSYGLMDAGADKSSNLEFVEIMGTFTGYRIISTGGQRYIKYGTEYHFGYEGMACTAEQAAADNVNVTAVYIGPGESEAGDQAIIDQYYLNGTDPDWATYASGKLKTWYSYVQGGGKYAVSPFDSE